MFASWIIPGKICKNGKLLLGKKFKQVVENAEGHQLLLANAYMKLAEKNQDKDFKKHTRFLKIFPQYFAMNVETFYADPEIETIKKLLLDLEIKMNIH